MAGETPTGTVVARPVRGPRRRPARAVPTTAALPEDEPTAAALIAAAVEVIAVHGYYGTSVRDIASAAGTSPAALYHHFESKHGLLATILDRGMDILVRATEDALDAAGDAPAARLCAIVGTHVRLHLESQRESLLGNSELRALAPPARALIVAKRDMQQRIFDRVVRDGVRQGVFSTPYPKEAAIAITTAATAVATWYRADGPLSGDEIVRRYQRIALDTVGHHPDPDLDDEEDHAEGVSAFLKERPARFTGR